MVKGFRIAAVSFLNTIPLLDGLSSNREEIIELILDIPSRLSMSLEKGKADAALVPLVEILHGKTGGIISPSGIACHGAVDSVKLFAPGPLGDLQRVFADRGSRSSVALLKILLIELYGVRPDFVEVEPTVGRRLVPDDGMLIIGDRCFSEVAALGLKNPDGMQAYDLGQMWHELTGLPFVFAAWAASKQLVGDRGLAAVCQLGRILTKARDSGMTRLEVLAEQQAALGRLGCEGEASPAAIAYYYRHSLRFKLGLKEREGIKCFAGLCRDHGLISTEPSDLWLCQGDESV